MVAILQHDPAASVAADVEEGPDLPILATDKDDRLSCDLPGDDVARFRDDRDMVDEEPLPGNDAPEILFEDARVGVEGLLQRHARHLSLQQFLK